MASCGQGCSSSDVVDCVVINKTVQHIIPEIIAAIKDEIKTFNHYLKDLSGDGVVYSYPDRILHKPFLRLSNGEIPPPNSDAILRTQRKEHNLSDVRATSGKKWLKKELISLIKSVSKCVRNRQIQILEDRRELLLKKVSKTCKEQPSSEACLSDSLSCVESRQSLLAELQDCESKLYQTHLMSSTPPKRLISTLASMASNDSGEYVSEDVFWKNYGHKLNSKSSYSQSVRNWYELLSSADSIISLTDWTEISNLESRTRINDVNARLTWIHRLQPNINRSKWSAEEDKRLTKLVEEFGEHGRWEEISKVLNTNRTAFICCQRWQTVLNPNFHMYRPWSTSEDTELIDILKKLLPFYSPGLMDWDIVSAHHSTRSANECRSRAPIICSAFQNINPKVQRVLDPNIGQSINPQVFPAYRPFSLAEDLQLLMAVQRYGIAGGRVGHGGGIGIGSWALVTTALPGRSASSCRKRYLELCEQFQPWTCYEDHNLYHLVLSYGPYAPMGCWRTGPSLQIFTNLLPYFPGRSAHSLQSRFKTLRRWAVLWYNLRKQITGGLEDSFNCNSLSPLEQNILLYSPFATQFVAQLKNAGVPDPETEAYRILTTWKIPKDPVKSPSYTWSHKDWKPNPIDADFMQFLDDLVSGILIQQHIPTNNNTNETSIAPHSNQLNNSDEQGVCNEANETRINSTSEISEQNTAFKQLTFSESKWIIHQTQIKHVIVGPVRRYLTTMAGARVMNSTHQSSSVLMHHRNLTAGHNSVHVTHSRKGNRASLLLRKDHLFWMTLDQVMRDPKVKSTLQQINKISMLRTSAPFIARQMVLRLSHKSFTQTVCQKQKGYKTTYTNLRIRKRGRCKRTLRGRKFDKHSKQNDLETCHDQTQISIAEDISSSKDNLSSLTSTSSMILCTDETITTAEATITSSNNTTTATVNTTTTGVSATTKVIASPNSYNTTTDKNSIELTENKRKLLLQIHSILKAFERKRYNCSNSYALATNIWSRRMKVTEPNVANQERFIPPIMRDLPSNIGIRLFHQPELISKRCLEIARSCLQNGLNLYTDEKESLKKIDVVDQSTVCTTSLDTNDSQLIKPKRVHILPPNYSTILGFKSLLMHLSTLLEKERGKFSQFTELRRLFCAYPGQTITDEEFEQKLREAESTTMFGRPIFNVARTLLSSKYTDFINRSLALLLWPALLATIPAKSFMEDAQRHWQDAYEHSVAKYPEQNDEEIAEIQEDDTIAPVNRPKRKRQRQDYFMKIPNKRLKKNHNYNALLNFIGSRVNWAKRINGTMTFTITSENGELLQITLPNEIRILYSCGFKPDSFLNLRK
uniref:Myb-like DNA-binding domain protein n=1 Tax=Schistosoma mansoni TaxID=6183 RepID=A0A5K4F4K7_SCHMA